MPLIERARRYEIRERKGIVAEAVKDGVEAAAILFLHSYRNPAHEQRVKKIVGAGHPGLFVTASHELSQEYRDFLRTSTVAANAYVGPRVRRYLCEMQGYLREADFFGDFFIVQSSGGLFDVADAQRACIRMLASGPAMGRDRHQGAGRAARWTAERGGRAGPGLLRAWRTRADRWGDAAAAGADFVNVENRQPDEPSSIDEHQGHDRATGP